MHFWINKGVNNSQGRRGANGRYVPPSLSTGTRRKELRIGKPEMVTPVHRFLPMEGHGSASPTHHQHHHNQQQQQHAHRSARFPPIVEEHDTQAQPSIRMETQRRRRRGIPTATPPSSPTSTDMLCVNLVKLLLLCLVIGSYYVIKYNISNLSNSMEHFGATVPLIIIIVVVVLLMKVLLKVCKEQTREAARNVDANHSQTWSVDSDEAPPPPPPFADAPRIASDVEAIGVEEIPPPPYSVAVMLPTHNERLQIIQDSPPPSYEKAIT
ncbi:PREDICTED: uncharacterized protein LOC108558508 [Nicrophorus vespilloides]|uniref:Uncharacterized protein LOC108558508 n=1 Tax=Nicrophorus vespilloides TaxID=110193 RepID=A0ABM1M8M1_NICVS|nr:PREDICTED: uncharacterized protein LOC108558508 [Nicrophorus vespilloides]